MRETEARENSGFCCDENQNASGQTSCQRHGMQADADKRHGMQADADKRHGMQADADIA